MNKTYQISGKTTTLKHYADVHDTIEAIKRIIGENYKSINDLAESLVGFSDEQTFNNIWDFVRDNIRYQNDEPGKEQLRTPQRSLHDATGDCDDMSILISAILTSLDYHHELIVAAYKKENQWQHIYPVAYDSNSKRYTIDCVPEIPHFNYEAKPIKNQITINMRLEELGQGVDTEMINELTEEFSINNDFISESDEDNQIQGLMGNIVFVDEEDEYDSTISGSELKENIILRQLMDAKTALESEIASPTELSDMNDNSLELQIVKNIIANFYDEDARTQALSEAIEMKTIYQNFYKAIVVGMHDVLNGLAGDDEDDTYYLKVMQDEGMLDEFDDLEGLGLFKKFRGKIKQKIQN